MTDNNTAPTFTIPKDVIEPIIQSHVQTAVVNALGGSSRLIEEAVKVALTRKVDDKGQVNVQDYYNKTEFLKWLVDDCIRKAAEQAVREQITADLEHIKTVVAKEIKNQRSPLTKSLVEGIAKMAADSARFHLTVNVGANVGR